MSPTTQGILKLALPKGHMQKAVFALMAEAGLSVELGSRNYRPSLSVDGFEVKILKPQNIVEMLHVGSRDIGITGADWVAELDADLVELIDTRLDPVRLVAAAPAAILEDGQLPARRLVVASEYERLARKWIADRGLDAAFVRSYGATEVFPPEDADCIVDNSATGSTLKANQLMIVDELLRSTTRLYAHPRALDDPDKRRRVEDLVLLLRSVLDARRRVMLEVNVPVDKLEGVVKLLPCMRRPTISTLYGEDGYAVKAAIPREILPSLIPEIKAHGGTDIVVTAPDQLIP